MERMLGGGLEVKGDNDWTTKITLLQMNQCRSREFARKAIILYSKPLRHNKSQSSRLHELFMPLKDETDVHLIELLCRK